nr:hypothetical protein [Tanacetum cinerariifolium]
MVSNQHRQKIKLQIQGTNVIGDLRLLRDGPTEVLVSSSNDKNGEIAGNGGIWPDDRSSDGSDYVSDTGGAITGVLSGMVVGIVPNKITRPAGVPMLFSDESDEIEITEMAITYTSKVHINHLYINHA